MNYASVPSAWEIRNLILGVEKISSPYHLLLFIETTVYIISWEGIADNK